MGLYKSADGSKLYNYDPAQNGGFALETQQGGIPVGVLPAGVLTAPVGANLDQGQGANKVTGTGTLERVPRYAVDPITGAPQTSTSGALSPLQQAQVDLFGDPKTRAPLTETEQQAIRDRTRAQFDEQIASINAYSNQLAAQATERGQGRLGQDRSIQNNRGTVGSSFGTAQTKNVEGVNASEQAAIESERQIKLAGVYDKIDQRALDAIQAEKAQRTGNANAYIQFLQQAQTSSREDIKSLAGSGIPLDQLPEKDFQALLKDSGYDPLVFKAVYNAALPKAAQIDYHYEKVGNSIFAFHSDPKTGKIVKEEFQTTAPTGYDDFTMTADGTPLFVNKQTGQAIIAPGFKQGQFNKPEAAPASFQEWSLAGKPGTYASYLQQKNGSSFKPTSDEKSAVNRFINDTYSKNPSLKVEDRQKDIDKASTDSGFFYSMLQKAVEESQGGTAFPLQPFKYPYFAPGN